jgi:hypothetical protein
VFYDKEGDVVVVLFLGGVNGSFIILGDAVGSGDASMAVLDPAAIWVARRRKVGLLTGGYDSPTTSGRLEKFLLFFLLSHAKEYKSCSSSSKKVECVGSNGEPGTGIILWLRDEKDCSSFSQVLVGTTKQETDTEEQLSVTMLTSDEGLIKVFIYN